MNPRMRLVLSIAVAAGIAAAAWLLAVAPKREQASQLGTEVTVAQARLTDVSARAAAADQARATYGHDYATVARLGKAVPVNADVPSLVYQLESAARRVKVDFRAVNASDPAPVAPGTEDPGTAAGGGIQPAPFSFKFVGDYFGLQRLLAHIDGFSRVKGTSVAVSGRLLTIDGVSLNPASSGLPKIQGMVTARAYVAEMPDQLPASSPTTTPVAKVTP